MPDIPLITGTFHNGYVELHTSVDWPDGATVTIVPPASDAVAQRSNGAADESNWGVDDQWPDTPENRAEILRRIDAVQPLEMTAEEEQEWRDMLDWFGEHTRQAVKRDMGLAS